MRLKLKADHGSACRKGVLQAPRGRASTCSVRSLTPRPESPCPARILSGNSRPDASARQDSAATGSLTGRSTGRCAGRRSASGTGLRVAGGSTMRRVTHSGPLRDSARTDQSGAACSHGSSGAETTAPICWRAPSRSAVPHHSTILPFRKWAKWKASNLTSLPVAAMPRKVPLCVPR
jgi:hypothetical protein